MFDLLTEVKELLEEVRIPDPDKLRETTENPLLYLPAARENRTIRRSTSLAKARPRGLVATMEGAKPFAELRWKRVPPVLLGPVVPLAISMRTKP